MTRCVPVSCMPFRVSFPLFLQHFNFPGFFFTSWEISGFKNIIYLSNIGLHRNKNVRYCFLELHFNLYRKRRSTGQCIL